MSLNVAGVPSKIIQTNCSPPTNDESAQLKELRSALRDVLSLDYVAPYEELTSDWKLLRFLRGYSHVVGDAATAYRRMTDFRREMGVGVMVDKMKEKEKQTGKLEFPYDSDEFSPLVDCLTSDGLLRNAGTFDKAGNVLTSVAVGLYDLRKIAMMGLSDLLVRGNASVDAYHDIILHRLTVERGTLAMRHDLLNVLNPPISAFQFTPRALGLINKVAANQKHYPEAVARITSCGNTMVAVGIWKLIRPFVPKHTTEKVRVLGRDFGPYVREEVDDDQLFKRYGGSVE